MKTQKAREDAAKEKIFSILPTDQKSEFIALFDEFEENLTAEANFAHVIDNLQPIMLNDSNDGSDWVEHQVSSKQIYERQSKNKLGSEILFEVIDKIIQKHIKLGNIKA